MQLAEASHSHFWWLQILGAGHPLALRVNLQQAININGESQECRGPGEEVGVGLGDRTTPCWVSATAQTVEARRTGDSRAGAADAFHKGTENK